MLLLLTLERVFQGPFLDKNSVHKELKAFYGLNV